MDDMDWFFEQRRAADGMIDTQRPMDPERLADLRRAIHPATHPSFAALLADRDHQAADADRLRDQSQRDAAAITTTLAVLAQTYLALDPDCPANADGTGEWDIRDPIKAASDLRERLAQLEAERDEARRLAEHWRAAGWGVPARASPATRQRYAFPWEDL